MSSFPPAQFFICFKNFIVVSGFKESPISKLQKLHTTKSHDPIRHRGLCLLHVLLPPTILAAICLPLPPSSSHRTPERSPVKADVVKVVGVAKTVDDVFALRPGAGARPPGLTGVPGGGKAH